jgi:hypothetical protein
MFVARRDFLRLIGIATAVGAVDPSALARTIGDRYFIFMDGRRPLAVGNAELELGGRFAPVVEPKSA